MVSLLLRINKKGLIIMFNEAIYDHNTANDLLGAHFQCMCMLFFFSRSSLPIIRAKWPFVFFVFMYVRRLNEKIFSPQSRVCSAVIEYDCNRPQRLKNCWEY